MSHGRIPKPTIVIGFAEALAAIETAWSLQDAGMRVVAVQREGTRPALRRVRGVELHAVPSPERDSHAAVAATRRLISALDPTLVMPLDDHAVWLFGQLRDIGVRNAGPAGEAADFALDKALQIAAARQAGLPVLETDVLQSIDDYRPARWPVMIKPARALYEVEGQLERPTGVICATEEELQAARARRWRAPILVQPLISGVGEGLFGHAGRRGVTAWSAHRRLRMTNPHGSGSSACVSQRPDPQLLQPTTRFLESIGWSGMFMLEFLRDASGTPWFMELNGRPWGSMALARRRGFEYPAWTAQAALDPEFEPTLPDRDPPHLVCRNLGLDLVHILFVARGPQSNAKVEWPSLGTTIRDVCRPRSNGRLYNWRPSQPDVLVADTLGTVGRYGLKLARRSR